MLIANQIIKICSKKNIRIATVESFTGGLIAYALTSIPGSSKVFLGSLVAYSLFVKNKFFNLPLGKLQQTQGVHPDISFQLAQRGIYLFNCDICLATVGFAGPKARKGVKIGTAYISLYTSWGNSLTKKYLFSGTRQQIRQAGCKESLKLLKEFIKN